jgi:hypothetical protein
MNLQLYTEEANFFCGYCGVLNNPNELIISPIGDGGSGVACGHLGLLKPD